VGASPTRRNAPAGSNRSSYGGDWREFEKRINRSFSIKAIFRGCNFSVSTFIQVEHLDKAYLPTSLDHGHGAPYSLTEN
jgi:hypothetical protein